MCSEVKIVRLMNEKKHQLHESILLEVINS